MFYKELNPLVWTQNVEEFDKLIQTICDHFDKNNYYTGHFIFQQTLLVEEFNNLLGEPAETRDQLDSRRWAVMVTEVHTDDPKRGKIGPFIIVLRSLDDLMMIRLGMNLDWQS